MSDRMTLRIVTPERVFYEGQVEMVIFQSTEGELGIMPGHIPLTTIIDSTVFYLKEKMDQTQKTAALHGGFVEILPQQITVVTGAAEWPDEIDVERARAAETRAREILEKKDSTMDQRRAELALMRSITRLQVKNGH